MYKQRSMLAGKHGVVFGARTFDENSDIQDIINALQEQDIFGGEMAFDIELDFNDHADNEQLQGVLGLTPNKIWWYSSKKPNISAQFVWLEEAAQKPSFNIFDFVDLIVARNKKDAWLYYHNYLIHQELQEVIPSVLWGIKSLFAVLTGDTDEMSPFVVNKMKKQSSKWTIEDVLQKQFELIEIYEGEIEGENSAQQFEKFLLTL